LPKTTSSYVTEALLIQNKGAATVPAASIGNVQNHDGATRGEPFYTIKKSHQHARTANLEAEPVSYGWFKVLTT